MRFTSNPYETMMKRPPRSKTSGSEMAPKKTACCGCPYWKGIPCVACYQKLLGTKKAGR